VTVPVLDPVTQRAQQAERVRVAKDIQIPHLEYWNYDPCQHHDSPRPDCQYRACGGDLFSHQRVGVSWLYLKGRGMLADSPGAGKTNQALGLIALLKQRGELTRRALIVCQTPAAEQWWREAQRWVPRIASEVILSGMSRSQRLDVYARNWDILVVGYHIAMRDSSILHNLAPGVLFVDDVDPILNHDNQTHKVLESLASQADRSVVMNATSIQTRLSQLHAALSLCGGYEALGSLNQFQRRYEVREPVVVWSQKTGRKSTQFKTTGYRNIDDLKRRVGPMVLRRAYEDLDDVRMPMIMPPQSVWLDLHPAQSARYKELQKGVLRILKEEGQTVKRVGALQKFARGQQICAGLPALGEVGGDSVKLDWLMAALQDTWASEKVVVYIHNIGMIEDFSARLTAAGIGFARIWGQEASAEIRRRDIQRFWEDPNCRVLMGTSAMERSLNLQVANVMVFVDLHLNPARVAQTVGRVRRAGSTHDRVFVFNLLARATQEEKYLQVLETRQALFDTVFEETSELFESLSPYQLLELMRP
jgi:SNF2 family DNA or RNA helicase